MPSTKPKVKSVRRINDKSSKMEIVVGDTNEISPVLAASSTPSISNQSLSSPGPSSRIGPGIQTSLIMSSQIPPSQKIDSVRELNRLLESALRLGGDGKGEGIARTTAVGDDRTVPCRSACGHVGSTAGGEASWRLDTARRLSSLLSSQSRRQTSCGKPGKATGGNAEEDLLLPALRRQSRYWIPLLLSWLRQDCGGVSVDSDFDLALESSMAVTGKQRRLRQAVTASPPRPDVQIEALRALTALTEWTSRNDGEASEPSRKVNHAESSPKSQPKSSLSSASVTAGCNPHTPLSAASQRLLLRHADAVPMIVSLLSSPDAAVHEQAVWILGSIASSGLGTSSPPTSTVSAAASAAAAEVSKALSSSTVGCGLDASVSSAFTTSTAKGVTVSPSLNETDLPALVSGGKSVTEALLGTLTSPSSANSPAADLLCGGAPGTGIDDQLKDARVKDKTSSSSVSARDVILAAGAVNPLLRCLEANHHNVALHRIGAWCLSSLVEGRYSSSSSSHSISDSSGNSCSSRKYSAFDEININLLLPTLKRMLLMIDPEVLSFTCWTLSHLCDGPAAHIAAVIYSEDSLLPIKKKSMRSFSTEGGLVPRLVELLLHPSPKVAKPALRTIGNIVCAECSDQQNQDGSQISVMDYTEVILDCNAVPCLRHLVGHENREIQKEACWTLSNIAAGTTSQIQAVINSGAIPPLVNLVNSEATDKEVRSEACWVVLNATSCGSDEQIEILVDEGCVSVLGVLLNEPSMVMMALEGLERVLQTEEAKDASHVRPKVTAKGGLFYDSPSLSRLQTTLKCASLIKGVMESSHNSGAVSKRARRIWDTHFVSCALCHGSFSRHRTNDARFCNECKCYVCSQCDCRVYHLSYQEELWAEDEDKAEAKKNAKKSKKQKKKEKEKQKKEKKKQVILSQQPLKLSPPKSSSAPNQVKLNEKTRHLKSESNANAINQSQNSVLPEKLHDSPLCSASLNDLPVDNITRRQAPAMSNLLKEYGKAVLSPSRGNSDDDTASLGVEGGGVIDENESGHGQPPIDLVLYLQQTGSIIALAKLMDSLYDDGGYEDEDTNSENPKANVKQRALTTQQ